MNSTALDLQLEMLLSNSRGVVPASQRSPHGPHVSLKAEQPLWRRQMIAAAAILSGTSLMAAVAFVAGAGVLFSSEPAPWTHGLLALMAAQSAIMLGIVLRAPNSKGSRAPLRQVTEQLDGRSAIAALPPLQAPSTAVSGDSARRAVVDGGQIGDRTYVRFADGTVQVETLLGRRRFVSLEAAEEFIVGKPASSGERMAA